MQDPRGLANTALSLGDLDAPLIEDRQILNQWWGTSIYLFASPTEFNSVSGSGAFSPF